MRRTLLLVLPIAIAIGGWQFSHATRLKVSNDCSSSRVMECRPGPRPMSSSQRLRGQQSRDHPYRLIQSARRSP